MSQDNVQEIKEAVVGVVTEKLATKADSDAVHKLEQKQADMQKAFDEKQAKLEAELTEAKNLVADLESKQNEQSIATHEPTELQFDTKALNSKLREVFSDNTQPTNFKNIDTKALTIGGTGGESLAIDEQLGMTIIERARENVEILSLIATKNVSSVEYREMVLRAYPAVAAQGEQTGTGNGTVWAQTATQTYVEVTMKVGKQYAKPLISREAIKDPHIDIMAHLETLLAEEVARYWALQVLYGTGIDNDLRGILHKDATNGRIHPTKNQADAGTRDVNYYYVMTSGIDDSIGATDPTAANSAIDNAIDLTVALKSKYLKNSKFVMNRRTLGDYRKLKDREGRPLIQFEQGMFMLVGYPVVIEDYLPDADGTYPRTGALKTPVIFGDLSRAYALCSIDDDFLYNPYKADGAIMLEYTSRKGDIVQNSDAIVVMASQATFA